MAREGSQCFYGSVCIRAFRIVIIRYAIQGAYRFDPVFDTLEVLQYRANDRQRCTGYVGHECSCQTVLNIVFAE